MGFGKKSNSSCIDMSCVVEEWPVGGESEHGMHEVLKMAIGTNSKMSPKRRLMVVIRRHNGDDVILIRLERE